MAALPNTIDEAGALLRAGELTSTDLVEASITTADRLDRRLGVYLTRFDERARADARDADRELAAGHDRGPLHGIPVGVKDMIDMAGVPTTAQSRVPNPEWYTGRDATVISRLRAAGAVLTGKTTLMEFGCGIPDAEVTEPLARNPHDPDRWAGGSSSGSAGGVAAGMFLAALGGDTAGSIRMPAAFCGVTGLMPTFGRVPNAGCIPLGYSLGRTGPIARTARDCAAVLAALTGSDPPAARPDPGLHALRLGVVTTGHFPDGVDPALRGSFDAAVEALTVLGARPRPVELPLAEELVTATFVTATSEGLAQHRRHLGAHWPDYTVAARGLLARGALVSGADYVQAQRVRRVAKDAVSALFDEVDVLVCPTAGVGAPPFDALADEAGHQDAAGVFGLIFTPYWNSVANPALAIPMGVTGDGLPLSLQIVAPVGGDEVALGVGEAYQRVTGWHRLTPPVVAA